MSDVQIRIPLGIGHRLHEAVFSNGMREEVVFCLVSHAIVLGRTILFVRRTMQLDDDDYIDDSSCGAAWRGSSMVPIIGAAMEEGLGVVLVHAHAFGSPPRLSRPDLESASRILPMLQRRVPGRPNGSIVLSPGRAGGVVALPGESAKAMKVSVRWMGTSIIDWAEARPVESEDAVFDRQALVVGHQGLLADARIAVVGLCGGGSHVVQQLAYSGIGTIIGIDADVCDRTNGHRNVGMRPSDGASGEKKTAVMDRLVTTIGTGSKFVGVDARAPEPKALNAVRTADIIVGTVDNLHARADLQEIAWRNVIPYIDVGVSIRALEGNALAPRITIGGNVNVFIPGGFCGWCCGLLSDEKLKDERDGRDDRSYFRNKKGEAQVVSFNGMVASQAVSEVIQLLTAFRGASLDPRRLLLTDGGQRGAFKLDGLRGTLEDWGARRRPDCRCCNGLIGAGTVVWKTVS